LISFDPWEWNWKGLAQRIIPEIESKTEPNLKHDSSTNALIEHYRSIQKECTK